MFSLKQAKTQFLSLWQLECVRCYERSAISKPNSEILMTAQLTASEQHGTVPQILSQRAKMLIQREGLEETFSTVIKTIKLLLWLVFISAGLMGIGLVRAIEQTRTGELNLPWLLLSLLGLHILMYLLWCVFFFSKSSRGGLLGRVLQQVLLLLHKKTKARYVMQSFFHTLAHYSLSNVLLSLISHIYWLVLLSAAVLWLSLVFLFQGYSFTWQTTVLQPDTINTLLALLDTSLLWLGFSLPSLEHLTAGDAEVQAQIGRWLLALVLVYGCGLRFLTAAALSLVMIRKCQRLTPDLSQAGFSELIPILTQSKSHLVDPEIKSKQQPFEIKRPLTGCGNYWLQLEYAFVVPEQLQMKLVELKPLGVLATLSESAVLEQKFHQQAAANLVILIDSRLTPDRGNLRLLMALLPLAVNIEVYLLVDKKLAGNFQESWMNHLDAFQQQYGLTTNFSVSFF